MATAHILILLWLALVALIFAGWQGQLLRRLWREPMLRWPVVIIESDDWGPGPPADGDALQQLAQILGQHKDGRGRCAVMTLGMLLAVPDGRQAVRGDGLRYTPALISEPRFGSILDAIRRGIAAGVFSPQLHGMEHYWPDAVLKAARSQDEVRAWLVQEDVPRTEDLPAPLQSRWVDASVLPSLALPQNQVASAAKHEVEQYAKIFGAAPTVVVPPTFVWTEAVEAAWAASGVTCIVTPGTRYPGRDQEGRLTGGEGRLYNGDISPTGIIYLVRDDYFEPALGHRADLALDAIATKTRAGRPTLLETHRFNFTGRSLPLSVALREVDLLLASATRRFAAVRFLSTHELAVAMERRDASLIELRVIPRVRVWVARSGQVPRLLKLAWVTGAIVPALLLYGFAGLLASMAKPRSVSA